MSPLRQAVDTIWADCICSSHRAGGKNRIVRERQITIVRFRKSLQTYCNQKLETKENQEPEECIPLPRQMHWHVKQSWICSLIWIHFRIDSVVFHFLSDSTDRQTNSKENITSLRNIKSTS